MKNLKNLFLIALVAFSVVFISCEKDESTPEKPDVPVVINPTDPTDSIVVINGRTYSSYFNFDSTKSLVIYRNNSTYKVDSIFKIKTNNDTTFVRPTNNQITIHDNNKSWKFSQIDMIEKLDNKYYITADFTPMLKSTSNTYKTIIVSVVNNEATVEYQTVLEENPADFISTDLVVSNDWNIKEDLTYQRVLFVTTESNVNGVDINLNKTSFVDYLFNDNGDLFGVNLTEARKINFNIYNLFEDNAGNVYGQFYFYSSDYDKDVYFTAKILNSNGQISISFVNKVNYTLTNPKIDLTYLYFNDVKELKFNANSDNNNIIMSNFNEGVKNNVQRLVYNPTFYILNNGNFNIVRFLNINDGYNVTNTFTAEKYIIRGDYIYVYITGTDLALNDITKVVRLKISTLTNTTAFVDIDVQTNTHAVVTGSVDAIVTDTENTYIAFKKGYTYTRCFDDGSVDTVELELLGENENVVF